MFEFAPTTYRAFDVLAIEDKLREHFRRPTALARFARFIVANF